MRAYEAVAYNDADSWAVESLQRLPFLAGLAAVLGATSAIERWKRLARAEPAAPAGADIEALPEGRDVSWARAAGNYVELHLHGRALLRRATLHLVEQRYGAGFIRIHRSTIVNAARIEHAFADSRRLYVVTDDGQRHPVSAAHRRRIEAALPVRPFVP